MAERGERRAALERVALEELLRHQRVEPLREGADRGGERERADVVGEPTEEGVDVAAVAREHALVRLVEERPRQHELEADERDRPHVHRRIV